MATIASLQVRLSAQIAEFQSAFKDATATTEKFQREFQESATKASAMGNLIARGAEIGIRGLVDLGKTVLDNASAITDLSQKTGLSMRTLQEFQFVADQTGTTVDAFANSALKLGTNLAGGSKSTVAAVTDLGLSFKELQALSPDEQFNKIAEALGRMENPQERNRIALELFGKAGKEILPAISEGYRTLAADGTYASDEQIKALDAAGDAWARFKTNAISHATSTAGAIILGFERIQKEGFWKFTEELAKTGGNFSLTLAKMSADAQREAANIRQQMKDVNLPAPAVPINTDFIKVLDEAKAKVAALTGEQRKQLAAAQALGTETAVLTERFGLNAAELRVLGTETKAWNSATKKSAAELQRAAEEAKRFWAELSPPQTLGISGDLGWKLPVPTLELPPDLSSYGPAIKEGITGGLPGIEIPITLPKQETSPFADALKKDLERIPMILRNAVVSGDWLGAAMEIGTNIGATIGQSIGTALGGKAGGLIGEAIGSLVGPLIGKIFGDTEYEKRVKKAAEDFQMIRAEAIETAGGLERLRHQFSIVGIEIDSAFKARDPAWLRQVLDEGYAKTQLLTEAMQEYGFTWEHLGAEGRALQLGDLLTDLKAKTDILIGAGIDELSVLQKQEAQYEDLLVKAIATNTEIPLAMKPLLERMQELGLLTDEATGQFIDLGQVTWAKSLTQGFDQVTKAIYDLRDALTKGVGGALDDLGRKSVRIPIGFDIENPPKGVPALASGGIVRRPTLALVGESGPEAVVPLSQLGGAGGGDQTIILEMDGRAVARVVVPLIPGEVRRYGLVS